MGNLQTLQFPEVAGLLPAPAPEPVNTPKSKSPLKTERAKFADWLVLTKYERKLQGLPTSMTKYAPTLGVTLTTLCRWKAEPDFERDVTARRASRVRMQIGDDLPAITRALIRNAKDGDNEAIRTSYNVTGVLAKGAAVEVGVGVGVNIEAAMIANGDAWEEPEWAKRAKESGRGRAVQVSEQAAGEV